MKFFPFGEKIQRLSELLKSEKEPRLDRTVTESLVLTDNHRRGGLLCSFVLLCFICFPGFYLSDNINITVRV